MIANNLFELLRLLPFRTFLFEHFFKTQPLKLKRRQRCEMVRETIASIPPAP
jgi:hypothetical protein